MNGVIEGHLERVNFVISDVEGIMVVKIEGILDTFNSSLFEKEITKVINKENFINVIFDCNKLNYMASTGVGITVYILKTLNQKGGNLILAGVPESVKDVLTLLGFISFLKMESTVERALLNLGGMALSVFPKSFSCIVCGQRLKARRAGKFRCPKCKTILRVNEQARIKIA